MTSQTDSRRPTSGREGLGTTQSRMPEDDYGPKEGLQAAWLKALGTTDVRLLRRRVEWDGVYGGSVASEHLLRVSENDEPDLFPEIRDWLKGSSVIQESDWTAAEPSVAFAELWHRIASGALKRLARTLPEEVATFYQAESRTWSGLQRDLSDHLVGKLAVVGEGVLWQAFNTRRTPSAVVKGHVKAQTGGKQRVGRTLYCSFLEELRTDGLETLTDAYPVLKRHLSSVTRQWLRCSTEILIRVHSDRRPLLDAFSLPSDATLVGIRQGMSDSWRPDGGDADVRLAVLFHGHLHRRLQTEESRH